MKKIFFLLSSMNVGGVEKAFLSMLPYIPHDKYEIHLGLLSYKGGFFQDIPDYVKVHRISCYDKYKAIINDPPLSVILMLFRNGNYLTGIIHLLLYIHFKITRSRILLYKYILRDEPYFPIKFDLAVAYAGPSQAIDYYICKKVHAEKKCGWIHFDVSKFGIDYGMTKELYRNFDKIFFVSEKAKEKFDNLFPGLRHKTDNFYNIVSKTQILRLSESAPKFNDGFRGTRILTVGRISEEKGQDYAIKALRILIDKGYNIKWYFVGDGVFRQSCEELTIKLGLEKNVSFLGVQKNPYGYMRDCDIYVQPSRHEGYCITLAEARVFSSPIVATDFSGAKEQLITRKSGFVIGFSEHDIAEGIIRAFNTCKEMSSSDSEQINIDKLTELLK